jgi:hypothetical protein
MAFTTIDYPGTSMTSQEVVETLAGGGCPKHPRWKKKRKPTSTCESCWFIWVMKMLAEKRFEIELVD